MDASVLCWLKSRTLKVRGVYRGPNHKTPPKGPPLSPLYIRGPCWTLYHIPLHFYLHPYESLIIQFCLFQTFTFIFHPNFQYIISSAYIFSSTRVFHPYVVPRKHIFWKTISYIFGSYFIFWKPIENVYCSFFSSRILFYFPFWDHVLISVPPVKNVSFFQLFVVSLYWGHLKSQS